MAFIDFRYVVSQWESIGVFDVILPMILIFTVVFAILKKTKILGGIKGIDAIVALVIAFFTVSNPTVSSLFMPIFSNVALGIIVLISILLFVGLFAGGDKKFMGYYWVGWIAGIAIFLWILSRAFSYYGGYGYPDIAFFLSENLPWIAPVLLVIIAIIAVTSEPQKEKKSFAERFFEKEKE